MFIRVNFSTFSHYRLKYDSDSDSGDENFIEVENLGPVEIPPNEHELQYTYNFWFAKKASHKASMQDYGKSLHFIGRCATVEQWWAVYCHLVRPSSLKPYRKLHLFKSGIKPMWEDPANIKGGKWILRLRKNKIDRAWESVSIIAGITYVAGRGTFDTVCCS
jgi:translation initiation factor 4E